MQPPHLSTAVPHVDITQAHLVPACQVTVALHERATVGMTSYKTLQLKRYKVIPG